MSENNVLHKTAGAAYPTIPLLSSTLVLITADSFISTFALLTFKSKPSKNSLNFVSKHLANFLLVFVCLAAPSPTL